MFNKRQKSLTKEATQAPYNLVGNLDVQLWAHIFSFIPLAQHASLASVCMLFNTAAQELGFLERSAWDVTSAYDKKHLAVLQKRFVQLPVQIKEQLLMSSLFLSLKSIFKKDSLADLCFEYMCMVAQLIAMNKVEDGKSHLQIKAIEAFNLFSKSLSSVGQREEIIGYVLKSCAQFLRLGYKDLADSLFPKIEQLINAEPESRSKNIFKLELESLRNILFLGRGNDKILTSLYAHNLQIIRNNFMDTPERIGLRSINLGVIDSIPRELEN